jgi:hypothetical protein
MPPVRSVQQELVSHKVFVLQLRNTMVESHSRGILLTSGQPGSRETGRAGDKMYLSKTPL